MTVDVSKIRPGDWVEVDERKDYALGALYGRYRVCDVPDDFGFIVIEVENGSRAGYVRNEHIIARYPSAVDCDVSPAVKVGD